MEWTTGTLGFPGDGQVPGKGRAAQQRETLWTGAEGLA